jgi:hypothetical protein
VRARLERDAAALVPGLAAVTLILVWAGYAGGYPDRAGAEARFEPDPWYLGALALLGLLAAVLIGLGPRLPRLGRATYVALASLGAYVAFSYLSILWAEVPGDAFDGANRALVYLAVFALFVVLPWRAESARLAFAVFAIGGGVVALVTALRLGTAPHPSHGFYIDGRLASPLSYQNANAAFFTMVALVGIGVGSRREAPFWMRGPALAAGGIGLQLAILAQSRGWLFTLPVLVVAVLTIVPARLRLLLFAALPVVATLVILGPLLDVFRAAGYHGVVRPDAVLDRLLADKGDAATGAILAADAVLLVVATLAALLDRRVRLTERLTAVASRIAAVAAVLVVIGGAVGGLVAVHGHVGQRIDRAWKDFKNFEPADEGANRFAQLGSSRYDFWRVSLDVVADYPLGGIGQDNFAEAYLQRRRSAEDTRWTHSLELRLLVHTGIVGLGLFAAFIAASLTAALRGRRPLGRLGRRPPAHPAGAIRRSAAAVALLPLAVWLVHGSVDWLWEFPTLSGSALAFLGIAVALDRQDRRPPPEPIEPAAGRPAGSRSRTPVRTSGRIAWLAGLLATLIGVVLITVPYVGERSVASGLAARDGDPAKALSEIDRAADLEPLSAQPSLVGGVLALGLGRADLAERRLVEARHRNGRSLLATYLLGLLASSRGDVRAANRLMAAARALSPRDPAVALASARLRAGRPLSLGAGLRAITQRYRKRFGP